MTEENGEEVAHDLDEIDDIIALIKNRQRR